MGKSKGLSAPSKAVDPSLAALFSESVGPAKPLPKTRYPQPSVSKAEKAEKAAGTKTQKTPAPKAQKGSKSKHDRKVAEESEEELADGDDEELSEAEESFDDGGSDEEAEAEAAEVPKVAVTRPTDTEDEPRKRKRKQRDEHDNLESAYFQKLADEDEPTGKRIKGDDEQPVPVADASAKEDSDDDMSDVPVHESVAVNPAETELEKATRTVFLANVVSEAITSRKAKKTLLNHMASVLDKEAKPAQKVESIRFRSTAFSTTSMPKRAAYITSSVMESTTKSTNAYVVYSTPAAARVAAAKLNGTMVLERHLRVDSVAHPAAVDHRRCVFVGNLGMVDDETIVTEKEDAEGNKTTEKRKRNKIPMDVEEGLWRVFGKEAGKVESVRVIRDPVTRVGQGIAYVQFYDGNDVEKAILLEGKKFPPMLPRALRVSRCKAPHKTKRAAEAKEKARGGKFDKNKNKDGKYVPKPTSQISSLAGRAGKLLGRSGAAQFISKTPGQFNKNKPERGERRPEAGKGGEDMPIKTPEAIIFEGRRASAKDGRPKDLKFKGTKTVKKKVPKPKSHGGLRAAKWRADNKAPK